MAKFDASEKKVRKLVSDYLDPNEQIERFISQGGITKSYLVNRVLVATDKRILFVNKDMTQLKEGIQSFRYKDISSINAVKGLLYGKIIFICGINNIEIKDVDKKEAKAFVDYVNEKRELVDTSDSPTAGRSAAEEIREFKSLLEADIITQEEFDKKKEALLS